MVLLTETNITWNKIRGRNIEQKENKKRDYIGISFRYLQFLVFNLDQTKSLLKDDNLTKRFSTTLRSLVLDNPNVNMLFCFFS